jgi:hypothetical protein
MENGSTSQDVDGRRHQWNLAFNARLLSARDVPEAMAQPVAAMRQDVACFSALLQGCKAALEAEQLPITSELMLLKRLIHRNRSQHGNSMHLRRLIQLRIAAERVSSSGLSTLINCAEAATHEDTAGGSVRGNTMPSRQLLDLLLARLVASAVLSQRAHRAARLAFRANEELIRHALFMPLAVTCLALSARLLRLTARYREALAESHLRLFAVIARAPINPQSAVHAPAAELMADMLAQAQLPRAMCSSNFEGQVACLRQLLGDTVEARDGDASASHDEDAAVTLGSGERIDTRAQSQSQSLSHSAETPAAGKATEEAPPGQADSSGAGGLAGLAHGEGRGKASAAVPRASDEEEDEGVSMQDLGVRVGGAPLPSQSSKLRPERDKVVGMVQVARVGAKASKTPKNNLAPHPAGARDKSAPSAPIPAAVSEVASSHSLDRKKKKKQKATLAEGKRGLSGSGAAALAALAAVAPPRASLDKVSAASIESKEVKKKSNAKEHVSVRPGAPAAGGWGKRGIRGDGLKGEGGKVGVREEGGRTSNTLMNMLLPSSAADGTDWDLWSGVQGAKRKRRDEDEAGEELGVGARSKEKKRVINQSGDEGKAAVKSHLAVGSAGPRDPMKKNSKEQKRVPKSASGIFSDLLPHGGWGD